MSQILIIGYGNPMRADDGLGWVVAEHLAQTFALNTNITIRTAHQLTPELADDLAQVDVVIFIDVSIDLAPGEFLATPVDPDTLESRPLTHHFSPTGLLALTKTVYGRAPLAHMLSIGAGSLEFGETLSEPVQAALPKLYSHVHWLVDPHQSSSVPPV
ncbi:MAG: hydrogenase maturation protease [Gemmatimonadetes bacterium]|nr:MAG: hydrogenase maturation protease [Gemmatimonadota bacterium]